MKIKIIIDNDTLDNNLITEEGFSAYIISDNKKILLDTGEYGNIVSNAKKLEINLLDLDYIVLSHGHHDHTNGLTELISLYEKNTIPQKQRPIIIAHPEILKKRYEGNQYIGSKNSQQELEKHFELNLTTKPIELTPNLTFLGEIPRKNNFEAQQAIGMIERNNHLEPDFINDDTALAYKSSKGLVIISGCSHSGICNIIDYAQKICKEEKIADIIGGLHLMDAKSSLIKKTIEELQKRNITQIHACHCTGLEGKELLNNAKDICQTNIGCGFIAEYEN